MNKPIRFNGQDYNTLRQEYLQRKSLFEDDAFPATVESLGFKELGHKSNKVKNIVWKRPKVGLLAGGKTDSQSIKLEGMGEDGGKTAFYLLYTTANMENNFKICPTSEETD